MAGYLHLKCHQVLPSLMKSGHMKRRQRLRRINRMLTDIHYMIVLMYGLIMVLGARGQIHM